MGSYRAFPGGSKTLRPQAQIRNLEEVFYVEYTPYRTSVPSSKKGKIDNIYQWNTSETGDINEEMDLIEYLSWEVQKINYWCRHRTVRTTKEIKL